MCTLFYLPLKKKNNMEEQIKAVDVRMNSLSVIILSVLNYFQNNLRTSLK